MRILLIIISAFTFAVSYGQQVKIAGAFSSPMSQMKVTFNNDSTFQYVTKEHPTFYRYEDFSEKGRWSLSGDTIILNPQLPKKIFVESDFKEEEAPGDTGLLLTCNHIKRYFDADDNIVKADTFQISRLDYSFNKFKEKKKVRITSHRTVRCTFAGYIPREIITTNRTVYIQRPSEAIRSIFMGCYELQGTKEFIIKHPNSNHFTFNVYSNYYHEGQIRQVKFLVKNANVLYTAQKKNGTFEKNNMWAGANAKLIRQKSGS